MTPSDTPHEPGTDDKGGKKTKPVCEFHGAAQACVDAQLGNWSNGKQCYMRREVPQPPPGDYRWQGHTDGSIWACVREQGYDEGRHLVTEWVWLPGEPDTVVIDPVTLAYRAVAEMQLAPPLVKSAPGVGQIGLVNMPVWLWVEKTENTWGPIVRSASVPGLSVTATAHVKAVNWALGDGNTVRCEGSGTPYNKAIGIKDSPDCGHRYKKTSRELPKCTYPVTASAQWDITWQSTLGDTGQISMTQQAATQLRIGEAVPVLVDPDGGEVAAPAKGGCG
ncbi:hypothetical protein E0H73_01300 [Kribbella pittospori]|uniref:ATP/GTP-binding protein n=1 Tax=Kribbella pittospori TaxID=722689 RepID=A0A4R0KWY0_9ACTN|nr:hypothetical protein [Kribbella pittospori]TCC65603.1 hypothetical protein E0H73_01300 [Kribbella pittospori]